MANQIRPYYLLEFIGNVTIQPSEGLFHWSTFFPKPSEGFLPLVNQLALTLWPWRHWITGYSTDII
jgi:hypothetical protein